MLKNYVLLYFYKLFINNIVPNRFLCNLLINICYQSCKLQKKRRKKNESKLPKHVLMNFEHVCFLRSFKKVTKQFSFFRQFAICKFVKISILYNTPYSTLSIITLKKFEFHCFFFFFLCFCFLIFFLSLLNASRICSSEESNRIGEHK